MFPENIQPLVIGATGGLIAIFGHSGSAPTMSFHHRIMFRFYTGTSNPFILLNPVGKFPTCRLSEHPIIASSAKKMNNQSDLHLLNRFSWSDTRCFF